MKHMIISLGLALAFNFGLMASPVNIDDINHQIKELLSPIQNERTEAALNFKDININSIRARHVAISAHLLKKSDTNQIDVNLSNLDYENKQGTSPLLSFAFSLGTDFSLIFSQEYLNEKISNLESFVKNLIHDFSSLELGNALTINSVVNDVGIDSEDNYSKLLAIISIKIDLSKLPEDVSADEIMFKDLVISLKLDVKNGLEINGYVNINPEFVSFKEGEAGLKEILEKIIAKDENQLEEFTGYMYFLNDMTEALLNGDIPMTSPPH